MEDVAHYTDYGFPWSFGVAEAETFTDGVLTGPELAGGGLVDEHDWGRVGTIAVIEFAAAQQGNAHRTQIRGTYRIAIRAGVLFRVGRGFAFDVDAVHVQIAAERELADNAGRFHAGKRLNALENLLIERHGLGIGGFRSPKGNAQRESVGCVKPGFDFQQAHETLHNEAGAGQQEQGQRYIGNNEQIEEAVALSSGGGFAAFFQCFCEIEFGSAKSGGKTESQTG